MGWSSRLFGGGSAVSEPSSRSSETIEAQMSPGLTGEYDVELREKAAVHLPPAPPEYMGLEGEYDSQGLVKRVALALDQVPDLADVETIQIHQDGGTVLLVGSVPDQATLQRIIQVAQHVDGTKAVDVTQVTLLG